LPKVAFYPAYQNLLVRKNLAVLLSKYKYLKLKLRVFLAGYIVAMVTYSVMKMITRCQPMTGQFFDTMTAAIDNKW